MELPSYFSDFLADIRPTSERVTNCSEGHTTLREQLRADTELSPIIVGTFLQGSYRRKTAIEPQENKNLDVDIVVVTRLTEEEFDPAQALNRFRPFVEEHYPDQHELQGRSIGIHLDEVDLDLVVTSAPSEAQLGIIAVLEKYEDEVDDEANEVLIKALVEARTGAVGFGLSRAELLEKAIKTAKEKPQWKVEPLRIPDRENKQWRDTHPIAQMEWTSEKNVLCNKHYINVVKAIKWWRAMRQPEPKYPKGYPLEHIIGACCPDGITSVAEGVTRTLEAIVDNYQVYAQLISTPTLYDHGVEHDVLQRVTGEDFAAFHAHVSRAAKLARKALDDLDLKNSANSWHDLFGDPFPKPSDGDRGEGNGPQGGFSPRTGSTQVSRQRFGRSSGIFA